MDIFFLALKPSDVLTCDVDVKPVRQRKISLGQPMHPPSGEIVSLQKNPKIATLPLPILETLKIGE